MTTIVYQAMKKRLLRLFRRRCRTGFLAGHITVPGDFDRMGEEAIRTRFHGR